MTSKRKTKGEKTLELTTKLEALAVRKALLKDDLNRVTQEYSLVKSELSQLVTAPPKQ